VAFIYVRYSKLTAVRDAAKAVQEDADTCEQRDLDGRGKRK